MNNLVLYIIDVYWIDKDGSYVPIENSDKRKLP